MNNKINKGEIRLFPGNNSIFLSLSIPLLNFISSVVRCNNFDFDLYDYNLVFLVISLTLASVDIFKSYSGFGKDGLIRSMRWFSLISTIFSGLILLSEVFLFFHFFAIYDKHFIGFDNKLSFVHDSLGWGYWDVGVYSLCYLISSIMLLIANIMKIFVNKKIEANIIKNRSN